jgi:hypothetical protein
MADSEDGVRSKPFQSRKMQQKRGKQTGGADAYMADHKVKSLPKKRGVKGPNTGGGKVESSGEVQWHITVHEDGVDFGSLQSFAPKVKHQCHAVMFEVKVTGKVINVRIAGPPHCFGRVKKWLEEYLWTDRRGVRGANAAAAWDRVSLSTSGTTLHAFFLLQVFCRIFPVSCTRSAALIVQHSTCADPECIIELDNNSPQLDNKSGFTSSQELFFFRVRKNKLLEGFDLLFFFFFFFFFL